jgi:hypothetical protein
LSNMFQIINDHESNFGHISVPSWIAVCSYYSGSVV